MAEQRVRAAVATIGAGVRRRLAALGRRLVVLDDAAARTGGSADDAADDAADVQINDRYIEAPPSPANAVELFAGQWSTRLPVDVPTGPVELIGDQRITSCVAALGGVDDAEVLELGPLEGAHSVTLRELGARRVVAIEANAAAFLRCLVTKEVTGLDGVEFRLGDFRPYLADTRDRFDLAVAVGVLYHLDDPVPVLADLARVADRIVIWTHVHRPELPGPIAERFDAPTSHRLGATTYRLSRFRYLDAVAAAGFCGGTRPTAHWIDRDDLLDVVDELGFEVVLRADDDRHPHGPAITLAIRRRSDPTVSSPGD